MMSAFLHPLTAVPEGHCRQLTQQVIHSFLSLFPIGRHSRDARNNLSELIKKERRTLFLCSSIHKKALNAVTGIKLDKKCLSEFVENCYELFYVCIPDRGAVDWSS